MAMSTVENSFAQSSNCTARPPSSVARAWARSKVRLATTMPLGPRGSRAGGGGEEGARGLLAGVAGADDHHVAIVERGKDAFSEFNGDRADRHAAALDAGFGADVFGDV